MSFARLLFTIFAWGIASSSLLAAGKASHVVLVVWDGMRPDFVTEETTPALSELANRGVTFTRHHPVYVSSTEVNGTALSTGVYPEQSGVIGNKEFRPQINASKSTPLESLAAVRKGDLLTGNHYLNAPTVAELLHAHRLSTAVCGAKGVTLLLDRAERPGGSLGQTLFEGHTLPETLEDKLTVTCGPFPPVSLPKTGRDGWTTRALIGPMWEKEVPAFSVLWLSEPDNSQHETGPGSPTSLKAISSSDTNLRSVLAELERRNLRDSTDIIVVSDHGFSTISENIDVAAVLNAHGFHAYRQFSAGPPPDGSIFVVGNGGSVFLYVSGAKQEVVERAVHFLQSRQFCGVLFTRTRIEGAFSLEDAKVNSPSAPDIVLSLRWSPDRSTNGTPGLICSDYNQYGPGAGMHGSLSPFDMHNTCIAAGPDFRKGFRDDSPTGNIDITPTVLSILGVQPPRKLSGRILDEALISAKRVPSETHRLEASYQGPDFIWHQYLDYSEVNGVRYFDQGNGSQDAWRQASQK
jgi:predicted AlkP superfamily pyrophosphatase or phosphodiesterase